jgi:segregation and condensation protein B
MDMKKVQDIVEALIFASGDPLSFKKIQMILKVKKEQILQALQNLKTLDRPYALEEVSFGYQFKTKPEFHPYITKLLKKKSTEKLTLAAQEVLAIVAFKPSITRTEIDAIRGVDSSAIIQGLLEKELIEVVGHKEVPGRPQIFAPAERFFVHFGIKSLDQLKK